MSEAQARVEKLEALLARVVARTAEPRTVAAAPARPGTPDAEPPMAPAAAALALALAPQPEPSSRPALPRAEPPPRPSRPAAMAIPEPPDSEPSTPVPGASAAAAEQADDGYDPDEATLMQAAPVVARPSPISAPPPPPVAAPPPPVVAPPPPPPSAPRAATPAPPLSAPRAVTPSLTLATDEDDDGDRVTPPPESGRQKALTPEPTKGAAPRPEAALPDLGGDEPESVGTLIGVGGGDTPQPRAAAAPPNLTSPAQVVAARAPAEIVAVQSVAAAPLTPKTVGDLLDAALAL